MSEEHVRAVVFDLGNTLWFEAKHPVDGEIERMQAERLAPLVATWRVTLPESIEQVIRDVWRAYEKAWRREQTRGTFREPSLPRLVKSALAVLGVYISDEQAEAWWRASWISERHFGVQLYPDAIDVLRELHEAGMLVGINTNRPCTAKMHLPGLRDLGIAPYVDAVVCSGDTGYCKPHASTFELVLAKLGVAPDEAAMVGDGAEADIGGAKSVGMRTVWKLNGRYDLPPCRDADYAIHDLAEVLQLPIIDRFPRSVVSTESLTPREERNAERYW